VIAFQEVAPEDAGLRNRSAGHDDQRTFPSRPPESRRAEAPSRPAVAARYVFQPGIFPLIDQTTPGKGERSSSPMPSSD
jgi:hypothetical protein